MGWLANARSGLKIRRASVLGSSKPLRVPGIGSLPVGQAEETASFPLIDMQFTVCSQYLEKKYLVSDSCPAEAWSNASFIRVASVFARFLLWENKRPSVPRGAIQTRNIRRKGRTLRIGSEILASQTAEGIVW